MDFMALLNDLRDEVRKDTRTQAEIAKLAKIHPKTFSAFMHGRRGLSVETTESLAHALGFTIKLARFRK